MRRRFKTYTKYNYNYIKTILYIIISLISFIITIKILFKNNNKVNYSDNMLAISSNNLISSLPILNIINKKLSNPETILSLSFNDLGPINYTKKINDKPVIKEIKKEPIIYIYNTHQTEDYDPGFLKEYNLTPTVYMASNILKKKLDNLGIDSIVEDENIVNILKENNWKYSQSYYASRLWLEKAKIDYPSVKYYLDLHRDSVSSSANINDIPYAKLMFVLGMNHENYEKNEKLIIKLYDFLNEKYPGLMRNTLYAKNNKFNQDFDQNTFLVEVGGPKNSIEEVQNSITALADAISFVIGEDNGRKKE